MMRRFFRQTGYFRQNRYKPLVALAVFTLGSVAGILAQNQPGSAASVEGKALLEKALRQLPQAEFWRAEFRQHWLQGGIVAEAVGSYWVGPKRRSRLEIRARVGDVQAELFIYCDGQTVWRRERIGQAEPRLERFTVEELEQAIRQANLPENEAAQVREAIWAELGYLSLRGRLRELANRLQWGTPQASQLPDGRHAWLLEGTWNEKTLHDAFRGQLPQAPDVPRRCRVFLLRQDCWWGGDSLWPARIEWLGVPRGEKDEKTLVVIEWHLPQRLDGEEFRSPFSPQEMQNATSANTEALVKEMVQRLR